MDLMVDAGLQPIELDRGSCANKIWAIKIKRLRLPDVLCLKTGVRVEVRGKSKLAILMSEAPGNEARRWFTGLRPDDLVAIVHCPKKEAVLRRLIVRSFSGFVTYWRFQNHRPALGDRRERPKAQSVTAYGPALRQSITAK